MRYQRAAGILAAITLIAVILLTAVDWNCFDKSFYANQYTKLKTASDIGMSQQDLDKATAVLLDYLQDRRSDLAVEVTIQGVSMPMFNQREIDHMVDVKILYLNAMLVRNTSIILFVISAGSLIWQKKKEAAVILSRSMLRVSAAFGGIAAALGFYAFIDFDSFWTAFHQLFFRNDLWLLDPNTDMLIRMVPEPFFNALVFRILFSFLGIFVLLNFVSFIIQRKRRIQS